jgi:hypothetical protein
MANDLPPNLTPGAVPPPPVASEPPKPTTIKIDGVGEFTPEQIKNALETHTNFSHLKADQDRTVAEARERAKAGETSTAALDALRKKGVPVDAMLAQPEPTDDLTLEKLFTRGEDGDYLNPKGVEMLLGKINSLEKEVRQTREVTGMTTLAQLNGANDTLIMRYAQANGMTQEQVVALAKHGMEAGKFNMVDSGDGREIPRLSMKGLNEARDSLRLNNRRGYLEKNDFNGLTQSIMDELGGENSPVEIQVRPRAPFLKPGGPGSNQQTLMDALARGEQPTEEQARYLTSLGFADYMFPVLSRPKT